MKSHNNKIIVFVFGMAFMAAIGIFFNWAFSVSMPFSVPHSYDEAIARRQAAQIENVTISEKKTKECGSGPYCQSSGDMRLFKLTQRKGVFLTEFKKVIIYYMYFDNGLAIKNKLAIFKFDNFNMALVDSIKRNFIDCYSPLLSEKEVVVVPPDIFDDNKIGDKEEIKRNSKEIFNTENITIIVLVEQLQNNEHSKPMLKFSYQFYRPSLPGWDGLVAAMSRSEEHFDLSQSSEADLKKTLYTAFDHMAPWLCHPPDANAKPPLHPATVY